MGLIMPPSENKKQAAILRYSLMKGLSIQEEFSMLSKAFPKENNTLTGIKIRIVSDCSTIINQIINHKAVYSELSNQCSYPDHFCDCICMKNASCIAFVHFLPKGLIAFIR